MWKRFAIEKMPRHNYLLFVDFFLSVRTSILGIDRSYPMRIIGRVDRSPLTSEMLTITIDPCATSYIRAEEKIEDSWDDGRRIGAVDSPYKDKMGQPGAVFISPVVWGVTAAHQRYPFACHRSSPSR